MPLSVQFPCCSGELWLKYGPTMFVCWFVCFTEVTNAVVDTFATEASQLDHLDTSSYGYQLLKDKLAATGSSLHCNSPISVGSLSNMSSLELATCAVIADPSFPPSIVHVAAILQDILGLVSGVLVLVC